VQSDSQPFAETFVMRSGNERSRLAALVGLALTLCLGLVAAGDAAPVAGDEAARRRSLAGQLLVAAPKLRDPNFARTVILMVDHGPNGAMGLVVNRPHGEGSLAMLLKGFGIEPGTAAGAIRLHFGGPVQRDAGFVVHSTDFDARDTIGVGRDVAVTASRDVLTALAEGKGPRRFLVAFGYAGWAPGQLESEMARDDWLVAPLDPEIVFDDTNDTKWPRALGRAGIDL
jgi:putative transcriptional regulator